MIASIHRYWFSQWPNTKNFAGSVLPMVEQFSYLTPYMVIASIASRPKIHCEFSTITTEKNFDRGGTGREQFNNFG